VRPRRRCVDKSRVLLQEVGCGYMEYIGISTDRDSWQNIVRAVNESTGSVNSLLPISFFDHISLSELNHNLKMAHI